MKKKREAETRLMLKSVAENDFEISTHLGICVLILAVHSRSYILAIQPLHRHDCVSAYTYVHESSLQGSSRGWNSCLSTIDEKDKEILWC